MSECDIKMFVRKSAYIHSRLSLIFTDIKLSKKVAKSIVNRTKNKMSSRYFYRIECLLIFKRTFFQVLSDHSIKWCCCHSLADVIFICFVFLFVEMLLMAFWLFVDVWRKVCLTFFLSFLWDGLKERSQDFGFLERFFFVRPQDDAS